MLSGSIKKTIRQSLALYHNACKQIKVLCTFILRDISEYMIKHVDVKYLGLAINDMILQVIRIVWLPLYIKFVKSYSNA